MLFKSRLLWLAFALAGGVGYWALTTGNEPESAKPATLLDINSAVKQQGNILISQAQIPLPKTLNAQTIKPAVAASALRYDLSAPEGRQAYYDALVVRAPRDIWADWDNAITRKSADEMPQVVAALGYALRKNGDNALYHEMGDRLKDSYRSLEESLAIIDVLTYAATPDATEQLLKFLQSAENGQVGVSGAETNETKVLAGAQDALISTAKTFIDGARNWDISPAFQDALQAANENTSPRTINTIAKSIAYIGKPEGVSALIQAASQSEPDSEKNRAAIAAIEQLTTNDSSEVLGLALKQYTDNKPLSHAIVRGLISIGSPDAATEVLNYLDRKTDLDKTWLSEVESLGIQRQVSEATQKVINTRSGK